MHQHVTSHIPLLRFPLIKSTCIISKTLFLWHLWPPSRPDGRSAAPRPLGAVILRWGHTAERHTSHKCEGCVTRAGVSSAVIWQTGFRVETAKRWRGEGVDRGRNHTSEEDSKWKEAPYIFKSVPDQHFGWRVRLLDFSRASCSSNWTDFHLECDSVN